MEQPPPQAFGPTITRLADVMAHTNKYAFNGVTRLAKDSGVNHSSVSRMIAGKTNPSFSLVARVTRALEAELGFRIDPRDVFAENGEFLRRFACDLAGCRGCLPDSATDESGDIRASFVGIQPGKWVTSRYPRGFEARRGADDGK